MLPRSWPPNGRARAALLSADWHRIWARASLVHEFGKNRGHGHAHQLDTGADQHPRVPDLPVLVDHGNVDDIEQVPVSERARERVHNTITHAGVSGDIHTIRPGADRG